jgi:hypothetical protein
LEEQKKFVKKPETEKRVGKKIHFLSTLRYKWAHYYIENSLIMNHIIKLFLVTFSFYYIDKISRLTSGVKVTSYEVNLLK